MVKNYFTDLSSVFIIAEAGVNHNGDINIAKKLIDVAAEAGVDAIKFQTFKTEKLVSQGAPKADYQLKTTKKSESQYQMIKKLELDKTSHVELMNYCKEKKIMFLSSPFDFESCDLLDELDIPFFKVPSGEITNLPFLKYIAEKQKPIILSTGMANIAEIYEALETIYSTGNRDVVVLHCVTEYPAPIEEVNLSAMLTIRDAFKVPVGYSDHTLGLEIPIAAVALGAKVIEKHFTLDKSMEGPDHKASLEPDELKLLVQSIRNVEKALGDGIKRPAKSEIKNLPVARKSIVAARDIKKGQVLSRDLLEIKRPGDGIEPKFIDKILGFKVNRYIRRDEVLKWEDLKSE
ncbi:N-acetylneuraminate synthase [Anoxybacter fermentans]|uniref:N-acetylneuraminate synthase n=1 Tax=Anoxybacter fermentans TaxID=1323375 RepID=A0A3Q9HRT1_9FIRM|nr:N-acetylneuraminate synthase [Anoxybacter fermentans]AZR73886.1 N-acetylneuraminate synthase [Anoxybacter fermentans]